MEMIFKLGGGIGLFLLGMVLLTDGVKAFAGDALRGALMRFTGTPLKAFFSGTLVTVLVQSSSATTVTVIGFVSAGLLTFPQAVGVVLGASLGTTGTGWIVAVLGLKVSIGLYALPVVGIGALLRLLGRGRWKSLGLALAGFGLIFLGIDTLQNGMQGVAGKFSLAKLPAGGLWGHVLAMLIGVILTVVMQSSSAAVATTLTALHTGAVNFEQAAALVIGAAIGTTVTGALAAIGGSVSAKRTAVAHVLFNSATGVIAVVLLPSLLWLIRWAQEHAGLDAGATSLAAFHTTFIVVGVVIFLPGVHWFARWIERLLPDKGLTYTRHLDATVLSVPAVALEATRRALSEIAGGMTSSLRGALGGALKLPASQVELLRGALQSAEEFFARIPPISEDVPLSAARVSQLHAIDHLLRLRSRLEPGTAVRRWLTHERLQAGTKHCGQLLELAEAGLRGTGADNWLEQVEQHARALAELRRQGRSAALNQTADGTWGPGEALEMLDALRWMDRVGYHTWRAANYLSGANRPETEALEPE